MLYFSGVKTDEKWSFTGHIPVSALIDGYNLAFYF